MNILGQSIGRHHKSITRLNADTFPAACCGVSKVRLGCRPASPAPVGLCKPRVESPELAPGSSAGERAAFNSPAPEGSSAPSLIGSVQLDGCVSNFCWRFKPVNGRSRKPATQPIPPRRKTGHNGTSITILKLGGSAKPPTRHPTPVSARRKRSAQETLGSKTKG